MSLQSHVFGGSRLWMTRAAVLAGVGLMLAASAIAQYPGQIKKQDQTAPVLRSVAVLEFTGDPGHPKTSRLIPVSVFDGQQLQDGGLFLARPVPLALGSDFEYQLQQNGRGVGYFVVQGAGQQQAAWVGQGVWKPLSAHLTAAQIAASHTKIKIDEDDEATDKPVLHRKEHDDDEGGSSKESGPPPDPDRPTLHKAPSADSGASGGAAADSDRPVLHKAPSTDDSAGNTGPDDPDRPRLKKTPEAKAPDTANGGSMPNVNDPDRPRLQRGLPAGEGAAVAPTVMGLPPDMLQEVAVSDEKTTPDHPWNYTWPNLDDEAKLKSDLEDIARTALGLVPPPAPVAPIRVPARPGARAVKPAAPPPPPEPQPLVDEQFRVFELAYGSGATMVLSAHTAAAGAEEKFVTLIAQPNLYGSVVVLMKSVTDAAHLDDRPRMRLVDAVDAMADNRGELLFELRGTTQRQFALYRVLRGSAEKIFATGNTYFGTAPGK